MPEPAIFDITRPVTPDIQVWPGDPPMELEWLSRLERGDPVNVASIKLGVHTGTHADAPRHVLQDGPTIGEIPVSVWVGPAIVIDARGRTAIDSALVEPALRRTPAPERILFRTDTWSGSSAFPTDFPGITADAAELIANAGVLLVGTDAPSIDPFGSDALTAHLILARAGVVNLENLALEKISPGEFELIALPLRLMDADGSPVRAILRAL